MATHDYDIGIIGGGAAGLTVASGAAQLGAKTLLDRKEKPLGIQILGPHAGELLSEWVAIMNGGVGLSKIGSGFSKKIFSDTVRKGLRFFFNFRGKAGASGQEFACKEQWPDR